MKKTLTCVIILFVLSTTFAQKHTLVSSDEQKDTHKELVYSNISTSIINFTVNRFELKDVTTSKGISSIAYASKATPLLVKDAPDVLKLTTSVIIPNKSNMKVEVISTNYKDFENIDLAPSKGNLTRDIDPSSVPYIYGSEFKRNRFFPGKLSELNQPYILNDYRAQSVVVYPFQYNPVTKILRVYFEIQVKISVDQSKKAEIILEKNEFPLKVSEDFYSLYERRFINFKSLKYTPLKDHGKMLIISHSSYISAMQPFINWKISSGMPVEIVDVAAIGVNSTSIKNYVNNYYLNNGLTYLLLVGDAQHIPPITLSSGPSDNGYGYLLGNDSYPEVLVGRFSAETVAHVESQVQKVLTYDITPNNNQWLKKSTGIASQEGPGDDNELDYQHVRVIRGKLLAYTYNAGSEYYEGSQGGVDAPGNPTSAMISNELNVGTGIINYTGHGSSSSWATSGFASTHINNLTNTDKWPFIWSVACVNGEFVGKTCFAESWLRATSNGSPTGALATFMATINQSWNPPMAAQDEMVDVLVETYPENKPRSFGALSINGCMLMNDEYGSQGTPMTDTWVVFGDPSVIVRTDSASTITANHNPFMVPGNTNFSVSGNIAGLRLTLSKNNQILTSDVAQNNSILLSFSPVSLFDTIKLVVTGFNKIPYIANIPVSIPPGPFVTFKSFVIDDILWGNSNGKADFNETLNLKIKLDNIGSLKASQVKAVITSADPYIKVLDSIGYYGTILQNDSQIVSSFRCLISDQTPDQHQGKVLLAITDSANNIWNTNFFITVNSPNFKGGIFGVDDSVSGNGNNRLEPGEIGHIYLEGKNIGNADFFDKVTYLLRSSSTLCTISNPYLYSTGLVQSGIKQLKYNVSLASQIPNGTTIRFDLSIEAGKYKTVTSYYYLIGSVDEDFETASFNKFNWTVSGNAPWTISNINPAGGTYSAMSGAIANNQTSSIKVSLSTLSDDTISFFRKVSCEDGQANNEWWDYLEFLIDDVSVARWDGEIIWQMVSYPVKAGHHDFEWKYVKDAYAIGGQDKVWIDNIKFPPIATPAGMDVSNQNVFNPFIYPNPVSSILNIKLSNSDEKIKRLEIIDILGKIIYHENVDNEFNSPIIQHDVSAFNEGVYFIKLIAEDTFIIKKFIIFKE